MPGVSYGPEGGGPRALPQQPFSLRGLLRQPEEQELSRVQGGVQEPGRAWWEAAEEQAGRQGAGEDDEKVQVSNNPKKMTCFFSRFELDLLLPSIEP